MGAARRGAARRVFEARVKRRPTRRFFPLQTGHRWWVARTLVVAIEAVPSYLFFLTPPIPCPPPRGRATSAARWTVRICSTDQAVKVLYTLDASPHTMIARVGHRVPVRVARHKRNHQLLGRVALKACLNAICFASPELLVDKNTDYIVYAADPEEGSHVPTPPMVSPRKSASATPIFVGKGFFSGGLDEPGEGTSYVTGHVRCEAQSSSAFSSDEEDGAGAGSDVLEIVLRLKESTQRGREEYQTRIRGMAGPSTPTATSTPTPAPSTPSAQVLQVLQAMQAHQGSLSTEQQSHLMGLLGMVAGAVQSGALPAPQEPASTQPTPSETKSTQRAARPGARDPRTELPRVCYNCGTTQASTWRIITLPAGVTVQHPAGERPPTDVVPLTWRRQDRGDGPIQTEHEARWQACNPCGLYYAKYGVSRPDYVRNFVARPSKDETKKREAQSKPTTDRASKRGKPSAAHTPRGLSRTLSAVAQRDAERVQQRNENRPPVSTSLPSWDAPGLAKSPARRTSRPSAFTSPSTAFGVSTAMMNSSPHTVLQTLMNETDMDFEEREAGQATTPSKLRGKIWSSPVRRSPRKQPPGTVANVNPYASMLRAASSPGPKKDGVREPLRDALTSPTTARTTMMPPLNPFMGLGSMDDEHDTFGGGPPSPSAGRTSRAKPAPKREIRTPSRMPKDQAWAQPGSPSLGLDEPLRLALPDSASIKDLFAAPTTPWMGDTWDADTTQPPSTEAKTSTANASQALVPRPARRPLPATVEDATSSHSGSPADASSEADDSLVDLIEDPYGLLSACGLGVLSSAQGDGHEMVLQGQGGGFSVDAFNGIELHQAPSFAQHLEAFTRSGGLGVAAHMGATPHDSTAVTTLPAAPQVHSIGHTTPSTTPAAAAKPTEGEGTQDLETFLDDPTVQAMLATLQNANAPETTTAVPTPAPAALLTS